MKWKCIRQIIYISRSTKRGKRIKVFWSKGGSEERKEKKKYIPPLEHPWKKKSFEKYLEKQQKAKGKGECIE